MTDRWPGKSGVKPSVTITLKYSAASTSPCKVKPDEVNACMMIIYIACLFVQGKCQHLLKSKLTAQSLLTRQRVQ